MKKTIIVMLSILFFLTANSQNEPSINIGAGVPIFFKGSLNWDAESKGKTGISGFNLFVEKQILITKNKTKLHLHPGVFYTSYTESKMSPTSALGGSSFASYKHNSAGLYNKFILDIVKISPDKLIIFSGVFTGVHVYSHTKGSERVSFPYNNPPYYWSSKTDGNGKLFYNQILFGLIAGVKPGGDNRVITPALEFTFFPYYAKLLDYYTNREDLTKYNSMLSVSVTLGIDIKKAAQK